MMEIERISAKLRGLNKLSVAILSQEAQGVCVCVCEYMREERDAEREDREGETGGETSRERRMQSQEERKGQWCVSPSSPQSVQQLSTSLFISPSVLPLPVCPACVPCCWYMTDPGEDVEVPCGQESQVGGGGTGGWG